MLGGDLLGSSADSPPHLQHGRLGKMTVLGSVIGGSGDVAGISAPSGKLGALVIGHNLVGGSAVVAGSGVTNAASYGSIFIGGDIIANTKPSANNDPLIRSDTDIGSLTVKGNIVGNAINRVKITAEGAFPPNPAKNFDLAIGKITVGGSVEAADILAGHDQNSRKR